MPASPLIDPLVEFSPPPAVPTAAPSSRQRRRGDSSRHAGDHRPLRRRTGVRGRIRVDSLAIAPTGIAFAIETKSRTFDSRHLAGIEEIAVWRYRRRRRWSPRGTLPILCVVRAKRLERVNDEVLIVSLDRLLPALRVRAGTSPRPRFLVAKESRH